MEGMSSDVESDMVGTLFEESVGTSLLSSETLQPRIGRVDTGMPIIVPSSCGREDIKYNIVSNSIPTDLRDDLQRPLTETERQQLFHSIDIVGAERMPHGQHPKALWIFGPPAVGKSTMADEIASTLFGRPGNAVLIDGDVIRLAHKGFQAVAQHGYCNHMVHADAWSILKKSKVIDKQKKEICNMAIENRQNVRIPDAALNTERITEMLDRFVEAGYEMHAICLWAPMLDTQVRGRARSVKAGKVFSTHPYRGSCEGSLRLGRLWESKILEGSAHYKCVHYYDNTVKPSHPVHLAQFEILTKMTDSEASVHSERCKAAKLAYERADIAASQARAQGAPSPSVARLWLENAREYTAIQSRSFSEASSIFSSPLTDMDALIRAERLRGRIEGVLTTSLMALSFAAAYLTRHGFSKLWANVRA